MWQWTAGGLAMLALAACGRAVRVEASRMSGVKPASPPPPKSDDRVAAPEPSEHARVVFGEAGVIGAWLVLGPFDPQHAPDEAKMAPSLGRGAEEDKAGPRWKVAASSDGVLDMASALDAPSGPEVGFAGGLLHVGLGGRHVLLIGSDGDCALWLDGHRVLRRDRGGLRREDDVIVALDLAPGDHNVVLTLHRRGVPFTFRVRALGPGLEPDPRGYFELPGTSASDASSLGSRMATIHYDRGMNANDYRPALTMRFRAGAPAGVPLAVSGRLVRTASSAPAEAALVFGGPKVVFSEGTAADHTFALPRVDASAVEDDDWTLGLMVAGRTLNLAFHPRKAVREAVAIADETLAAAESARAVFPSRATLETLSYLRDRLAGFANRGDSDVDAQVADARELRDLAANVRQNRDPYFPGPDRAGSQGATLRDPVRTGPMRRAYRSPVDGRPSEFAVYVPPGYTEGRRYPLIVALHGMNGHPMQMLMWLFGHDDPARDAEWEDRHPRVDLEALDAVVVAPDGHFNAMYRDLGEDDVMRVVAWASDNYSIDPARVTITGPSMGGIGAAACALHHPDRFAAAAPLCGYHSFFLRSDIAGRTLLPWERFIAGERSNVSWAENGQFLPLLVVHGTKDVPEANSAVLIDRYDELHYSIEHEHPDLGHNVWQTTYEKLKGANWLLAHRRPMHPRALRFKTPSTRWADDAWLHVRELASSDEWAEVSARVRAPNAIAATTRGVNAVGFDRDPELVDDAAPVTVVLDGEPFTFQAGEALELHRDPPPAARWQAGPPFHPGLWKSGTVTGPIGDVFHEPIVFVWGASDAGQSRANEETAHEWARVRAGVRVEYPVMSDAEFLARGEPLANEAALFLVGNADTNALVRTLEPALPIRVEHGSEGRPGAIAIGALRIEARDGPDDRSQLGTMFIVPNPRRASRYVVVVEGLGPLGVWRSNSLPEMLPDYVVFDEDVAPAHGQLTLSGASLRAAGFFAQDWSLSSSH